MAGVLRRLHRAGIRKSFVVVAPTSLQAEGGPLAAGDVQWWSGLCDRIQGETGRGVVLVSAADRGLEAERVLRSTRLRKRITALNDLAIAERSALLEIARGICTGDRDLLVEARVLGTPNYELGPWRLSSHTSTDSMSRSPVRLPRM
jgi:hypothetical protein